MAVTRRWSYRAPIEPCAQRVRREKLLPEMRRKVSEQKFADYEATYDQVIARRYPAVTLCAYDVRRFSGVGVLDALKAHRDTFRYPLERALA